MGVILLLGMLVPGQVAPTQVEHDGLRGLAVQLETDRRMRYLYDPLFVRVTVTNATDQTLKVGTDLCRTSPYKIITRRFQYTFDTTSATGTVTAVPMKAGAEWIVDYQALQMPPIEQYEHDFWLIEVGTSLVDITTQVGSELVAPYLLEHTHAGIEISLSTRPDDEREFLFNLYAEMDRRRKGLSKVEHPRKRRGFFCPNPKMFGLRNFSRDEDLVEKLLDYEESLSPGSLRDIVHLTRLARALYDEKDTEKKVERAYDIVEYLEELPQIEREILQQRLFTWMSNKSNERAYYALTEMIIRRTPRNVYHYKDYPMYLREECIRETPGFVKFVSTFVEPDLPRNKPNSKADSEFDRNSPFK